MITVARSGVSDLLADHMDRIILFPDEVLSYGPHPGCQTGHAFWHRRKDAQGVLSGTLRDAVLVSVSFARIGAVLSRS